MGLFCNPLYDFTIEERPVYWRMLMCQLLLDRGIAQRSRVSSALTTSDRLDFDPLDVDAIQRGGAAPDELLDEAFRAALTYTAGATVGLKPDN